MKYIHMKISLANPKIKQQINLIFLLCSIIPICLFGIFAIFNARKEILAQYETQIETDAIRVNSTLFDITTSVMTNTASISDNADFRNLLNHDYKRRDETNYAFLNSSLKAFRSNTAAISSITIYTDNPTIPNSDYIVSMPSGFASESWYQISDSPTYHTWSCIPYQDRFNHTIYELTLIKKIPLYNTSYQAYLVTRLDSNYLRNRLLTNHHLIIASIDDGNVFFSSNRSFIWSPMPYSENFHNETYRYTGPITINDTSLLSSIVTFIPYKTNHHFYILVSDLHAYENINQVTRIYLVILLFATIVPTLLILFFSSYFSGRIQILKRVMHQASLGNYHIIEQFDGDDELAETFQDLKTTVNLIHQKEAKYYKAQIMEQQLINNQQQMEFKMLASQINPHFLYNTLETIRMQAIASNNKDVASSIKLLGKSMHYVLENTGTDSTTIAKELDHVVTYLKIQKLRFGDRVNYQFHIPPYLKLEQFRILPLLLQPIVENAIVHGLESNTQSGLIEISIILEEPNLYIVICNNKGGMDSETLERLQQHINQREVSSSTSIGLRNINQRLRLLYGDEYGLMVESAQNVGTTVTLTFPLEKIIDQNNLSDIFLRREQYLTQDFEYEEQI